MLHRPDPATETNDLVARWQRDKDERARDTLVKLYWPLIRAHGSKLASQLKLDPDDVVQESAIGFVRALDTFDPEIGALATYFRQWARSKVGHFRENEGSIRIPAHVRSRERAVYQAIANWRRDNDGQTPTAVELAAHLGWTEKQVTTAQSAPLLRSAVSMSKPIGDRGDGEFGNLLAAGDDVRPDTVALGRHEAAQARAAILQAARLLSPRYRVILVKRLIEGLSLEEAGSFLGVTRERARQIEARAIEILREALRYDPRALNIIGLEVEPPEQIGRADSDGLTLGDVAALSGMGESTIRRMVDGGEFPAPTLRSANGQFPTWDKNDVTQWLTKRGLSTPEVAKLLGVRSSRVHGWRARGLFPAPVNPGRYRPRWSRATVEAWAARHMGAAAPDTAKVGDASVGVAA